VSRSARGGRLSGEPADVGPRPDPSSALDESPAADGSPAALDTIPLPRWLGPLAVLCVIGLVPWIVYLAMVLPHHARSVHYDIAWVGFDIAMWFVLAALAWCAIRRRPATAQLAAVAAMMLIVDAWFDVVTTANPSQRTYAIASAAIVEIPLAVLCAWVAVNAERLRERRYRRLWQRAEQATGVAKKAQTTDQAAGSQR
jgi:hypothetical protein